MKGFQVEKGLGHEVDTSMLSNETRGSLYATAWHLGVEFLLLHYFYGQVEPRFPTVEFPLEKC